MFNFQIFPFLLLTLIGLGHLRSEEFIDGGFNVDWFYDGQNSEINFFLDGNTTGYVAVGVQEPGSPQMLNADIFLGWISDDQIAFKDLFMPREQGAPQEDVDNNWEVIEGCERNGRTYFSIKRKFVTGDTSNDLDIKDSMNILIALGQTDAFIYHLKREKKLLNLRSGGLPQIPPSICSNEPQPTTEPAGDSTITTDSNSSNPDTSSTTTSTPGESTTSGSSTIFSLNLIYVSIVFLNLIFYKLF